MCGRRCARKIFKKGFSGRKMRGHRSRLPNAPEHRTHAHRTHEPRPPGRRTRPCRMPRLRRSCQSSARAIRLGTGEQAGSRHGLINSIIPSTRATGPTASQSSDRCASRLPFRFACGRAAL
jgi:hypothetical protein